MDSTSIVQPGDPSPPDFHAAPLPPPPLTPRVWPVFVAFGAVMAGSLAVGFVIMIPIILANGGELPLGHRLDKAYADFLGSVPGLLLLSCTSIGMFVAAVLGAALSPVPWRRRLLLSRPSIPLVAVIPAVVGFLALAEALWCVISILGLEQMGTLGVLGEMFSGLSGGVLVLAVVEIGLMAGIAEELLFRGYMQSRLRERWGSVIAIIVTSILFGILHLDPIHSLTAMIMGLYLGFIAVKSASVWFCIATHIINNTISVLGSAWGLDTPADGTWLLIYLLIMSGCLWTIHRMGRVRQP